MLDLLRARLRQRVDPVSMPAEDSALPRRFRGRPAVSGDATRSLPVIDLGCSVFAPEELAQGDHPAAFTAEYSMATRTREALVMTNGELELATALDAPSPIQKSSLPSAPARSLAGCSPAVLKRKEFHHRFQWTCGSRGAHRTR
jgi:hypothetical protein